jgi:hypothetical protein
MQKYYFIGYTLTDESPQNAENLLLNALSPDNRHTLLGPDVKKLETPEILNLTTAVSRFPGFPEIKKAVLKISRRAPH